MRRYRHCSRYWTLLPLALLALLGLAGPAAAESPRNVGLTSFSAVPTADGIRLTWETATELGTAGFRIARSDGADANFLTAIGEDGFVVALGGVTLGATYEAVDETAELGRTYTYELYEVEVDNSQQVVAQQVVRFELPTPTRPIVLPTEAPAQPEATRPNEPTAIATPVSADDRPPSPQEPPVADATAIMAPVPTATAGLESADRVTIGAIGAEVAAAQGAAPVAAQDAYPAQPTPTAALEAIDPAFAPPTAIAYPLDEDSSGLSPVPIGGQPVQPLPGVVNAAPAQPAAEGEGLPFLWLGFLATLLIFGASVIGAIILFARRNEP